MLLSVHTFWLICSYAASLNLGCNIPFAEYAVRPHTHNLFQMITALIRCNFILLRVFGLTRTNSIELNFLSFLK